MISYMEKLKVIIQTSILVFRSAETLCLKCSHTAIYDARWATDVELEPVLPR